MGVLDQLSDYFSDFLSGAKPKTKKKKKQLQTVDLKVRMDCEGCERKVHKALSSLKGVKTIDIDRKMHKVSVTGYVEPKKVLKKVKATGKRAEMWPYVPYNLVAEPYSAQTYDKKAPAGFVRKDSNNLVAVNPPPDEKYTAVFSEENPNACSVM
eukprot:TRINITY_DN1802_c0_g1_i1.p2 TRINITY_DN1802_c0_g1~~TRINITY_DN1802_c0_g1_i1.p2  ORF type:complete len:154 (-),score=34.71 TRINITY_DN1802_c0_g1_i1:251-712(-)